MLATARSLAGVMMSVGAFSYIFVMEYCPTSWAQGVIIPQNVCFAGWAIAFGLICWTWSKGWDPSLEVLLWCGTPVAMAWACLLTMRPPPKAAPEDTAQEPEEVMPGYLLAFTAIVFGRRLVQSVAFAIAGACLFFGMSFDPNGYSVLCFAMVGHMCLNVCFSTIYVAVVDRDPLSIRTGVMSLCQLGARTGLIFEPLYGKLPASAFCLRSIIP
mmetsp:Transcript_13845/g.27334  ORF Transcript_13845/g.27334 Transcript_13845/m.27334 type:complete len:214 (-) Transcript_13845:296-937(-)